MNKYLLNKIKRVSDYEYILPKNCYRHMIVDAKLLVSKNILTLLKKEYINYYKAKQATYIPCLMQLCNAASIPGSIKHSIGLPDIHTGYGFPIGCVSAIDMDNPNAIITPGGIGYDINCGVRMIRTNLKLNDIDLCIQDIIDEIACTVPVGVAGENRLNLNIKEFENILSNGMNWALQHNFCWESDLQNCEENGYVDKFRPNTIKQRAKARGMIQLGTLGSGNHYIEIQKVADIYDIDKARICGITDLNQIVISIHTGSRGLGHQVCSDYLKCFKTYNDELNYEFEKMKKQLIPIFIVKQPKYTKRLRRKIKKKKKLVRNTKPKYDQQKAVDRLYRKYASRHSLINFDDQLVGCPLSHELSNNYISAVAGCSNYAWVNRSIITNNIRNAFSKFLNKDSRDLDMELVYDVSHNNASVEDHIIEGKKCKLFVQRKGASKVLPINHNKLQAKYKAIGQPVIVGGSMGTSSYVVLGAADNTASTFNSLCHGSGRQLSRTEAKEKLNYINVIEDLKKKNIKFNIANEKTITEESPDCYKNIDEVIDVCVKNNLCTKCFKVLPIGVIKG